MGPVEIANPQVTEPRQPPLATRDSMLTRRQNVAGLWLKYGVKSLKIETSSRCKILHGVRRFVDDNR